MPFESKAQQRYMFSQHPEIAKEFAKKTKDMKDLPEKVSKKESADGSASDSALFKEELPRKMVFQEVWMNMHEKPPEKGRQLEAAEEGTLIGRLASRMASRDLIDELDMGPKGRSPEAKKAQVADMQIPGPMRIEGVAQKDLKVGEKIEHEHDGTVSKLMKGKLKPEDAPKAIRNDHLKEFKKYYDDKNGLPAMEKKLEKADFLNEIPSKLMVGPGLHQQTQDIEASNMSDATPDKGVRKGKNMAEQARNAGNVFDTMHKKDD